MNDQTQPTEKGFWDDAEIISIYTRAQAIEDGVLVDVTDTAKEAGFASVSYTHLTLPTKRIV